MTFKKGDKVRVIAKNSPYLGKTGKVADTYKIGMWFVPLEIELVSSAGYGSGELTTVGFWVPELDLADTEREALIELAETLDKARRQANASGNSEIESQRGVYGTIAMALGRTLAELVGHGKDATRYATSDRVYDAILDGSTVRGALAAVLKEEA